jgi:hypothetical protein
LETRVSRNMNQNLVTVEIPLNYCLQIDSKQSQDWQQNITEKRNMLLRDTKYYRSSHLRSQDLVVKKSEFECYCTIYKYKYMNKA